jgi:hypothetical protein
MDGEIHLPTIPLTVTTRCVGFGLFSPSPAPDADVPSSSPAADTVKHPGRGRHAAPESRRCHRLRRFPSPTSAPLAILSASDLAAGLGTWYFIGASAWIWEPIAVQDRNFSVQRAMSGSLAEPWRERIQPTPRRRPLHSGNCTCLPLGSREPYASGFRRFFADLDVFVGDFCCPLRRPENFSFCFTSFLAFSLLYSECGSRLQRHRAVAASTETRTALSHGFGFHTHFFVGVVFVRGL